MSIRYIIPGLLIQNPLLGYQKRSAYDAIAGGVRLYREANEIFPPVNKWKKLGWRSAN
jgi:hypothetical protein